MYKVFIDNKPIIFTEKWIKSPKTLDFVLVNVNSFLQIDLVKCRFDLPIGVLLVVIANYPEKAIQAAFSSYKLVEAAGGIVKRKNTYLFIERLGVWDLPKGKMEQGESPKETAVREIEEECGISNPIIGKLLGVTYHTYTFKGELTLKKNWWYSLKYDGPKELSPQSEEDITQAVWLTKKEWGKVMGNTYASIIEVINWAK